MTSPASPSGAEFRLDVEKARAAIEELRRVYQRLVSLRKQAVNLARPDRSAVDLVSAEAFDLLAQKADGGPGSFTAAMDAGMIHVDSLIKQMQADIRRQEQVDSDSATRIART